MEVKDLSSITYASYNPRTLSEHDGKSLETSMNTFGDIAGITKNASTGILVTGHQRLKVLNAKYGDRVKIYIEHKYEHPDEFGTVALGYVGVQGTNLHFAYREVSWDAGQERAANVAANRIEADWDQEALAKLNYEISRLENGADLLAISGQSESELKALNKLIGVGPDEPQDDVDPDAPENNKREIAATREQWEIIDEAIGHIKTVRDMATEETGSQNGTALYYMSRDYLDRLHGLIETNETPSESTTTTNPSEPIPEPTA